MNPRWKPMILPMAVAALAGWGCGGGAPPASASKEVATIKGVVRIRGKAPAPGAELVFDSSNINRRDAPTRVVPLAKDGSYSVTTLVGENVASLRGRQVSRDPKLSMNRKFIDVPSGRSDVQIELP